MKKNFLAAIFCCFAISFGGCKEMSDELKAIQGKDGIFAIMKTTSGSIVLELFYKETPLTVTNFVGLAEGTLDAAKGKPGYLSASELISFVYPYPHYFNITSANMSIKSQ